MKLKTRLKRLYSKVEKALSVTAKTLVGTTIVGALVVLSYLAAKPDVTSPTVMLVSLYGGGGTGVIISNSDNYSEILTNGHVCKVLTNGGLAISTTGEKHLISDMIFYDLHDLCLVSVRADLHSSADLASLPALDYSVATVSGHPRLLPNVVSSGHFSSHQIIDVWVGNKPCSKEQLDSYQKIGRYCRFFGTVPIIKTYETRLVTAVTMPGSSGSAIYNSSGELSALVFAGGNGTTFAVPYEYIADFLFSKKGFPVIYPKYELDVENLINGNIARNQIENLNSRCAKTEDSLLKKTCKVILRDLEWRNNEVNTNSELDTISNFAD